MALSHKHKTGRLPYGAQGTEDRPGDRHVAANEGAREPTQTGTMAMHTAMRPAMPTRIPAPRSSAYGTHSIATLSF